MSYELYSEKQIDAAHTLIELILPDADDFEMAVQTFDETLADWDDEEASIALVVLMTLKGEASFVFPQDDNAALIGALDALAQRWDAGLMYGSHDPDGEFTHHHTVPALLGAAALELQAYGYHLWLLFPDEEQVAGFIARAEDDELLARLGQTMAVRFYNAAIEYQEAMIDG